MDAFWLKLWIIWYRNEAYICFPEKKWEKRKKEKKETNPDKRYLRQGEQQSVN